MRLVRASALCAMVVLGGCAWAARQKDELLVDSGFTPVRSDTPGSAASMGSLPPQEFAHRVVNGMPVVFYADPVGCHCVYSGPEAAYETYKQIRANQLAAFTQSLSVRGSLR